jgi:hypothetical protein
MGDLYVDDGLVVWARDGEVLRFDDGLGLDAALSRCLVEVKRRRRWFDRRSVRIWLSGALARPFVLEPVEGLRSVAEATALAQAAAASAAGLNEVCAVALESLPVGQPALVTAVEQRVLDALLATLKRHRMTAQSVRPWWARVLEKRLRTSPQPQLVCIAEGRVATLLAGEGPAVAMTVMPTDAQQLGGLVRRVCAGQGIEPAQAEVTEVDLDRWGQAQGGGSWSPLAAAIA